MGRLSEKLAPFPVVGLDTSIFIYHLEAHPTYLPLTKELLTGVEDGQWKAVTSTITLMELTVRSWQTGRQDIARKYETLLYNFPNLSLFDIDRDVARRAAQLRAKFHIRPADALQVATCLVHGVNLFITNDPQLVRLHPILNIIILDDLVK